jgi:hypothetical protein
MGARKLLVLTIRVTQEERPDAVANAKPCSCCRPPPQSRNVWRLVPPARCCHDDCLYAYASRLVTHGHSTRSSGCLPIKSWKFRFKPPFWTLGSEFCARDEGKLTPWLKMEESHSIWVPIDCALKYGSSYPKDSTRSQCLFPPFFVHPFTWPHLS